jgi:general stress protein YciG
MGKEHRGFASMDRDKQREIASKGGRAAHVRGTAHEWTSEQAREAGRKGGLASHMNRHSAQSDRATAATEPSMTETAD